MQSIPTCPIPVIAVVAGHGGLGVYICIYSGSRRLQIVKVTSNLTNNPVTAVQRVSSAVEVPVVLGAAPGLAGTPLVVL